MKSGNRILEIRSQAIADRAMRNLSAPWTTKIGSRTLVRVRIRPHSLFSIQREAAQGWARLRQAGTSKTTKIARPFCVRKRLKTRQSHGSPAAVEINPTATAVAGAAVDVAVLAAVAAVATTVAVAVGVAEAAAVVAVVMVALTADSAAVPAAATTVTVAAGITRAAPVRRSPEIRTARIITVGRSALRVRARRSRVVRMLCLRLQEIPRVRVKVFPSHHVGIFRHKTCKAFA